MISGIPIWFAEIRSLLPDTSMPSPPNCSRTRSSIVVSFAWTTSPLVVAPALAPFRTTRGFPLPSVGPWIVTACVIVGSAESTLIVWARRPEVERDQVRLGRIAVRVGDRPAEGAGPLSAVLFTT